MNVFKKKPSTPHCLKNQKKKEKKNQKLQEAQVSFIRYFSRIKNKPLPPIKKKKN